MINEKLRQQQELESFFLGTKLCSAAKEDKRAQVNEFDNLIHRILPLYPLQEFGFLSVCAFVPICYMHHTYIIHYTCITRIRDKEEDRKVNFAA